MASSAASTSSKKVAESGGGGDSSKSEKELTPQQIVDGFKKLRDDQQMVIAKIGEMEADRNEHRVVAETLATIDVDRKCYRLIGGVLVERTVKEVLPALTENADHLAAVINNLNEHLVKKGREINDYREKHNIRFANEMEGQQQTSIDASKSNGATATAAAATGGVLIS